MGVTVAGVHDSGVKYLLQKHAPSLVWLGGLWLALTFSVPSAQAAVVGSESVNQWRRLTIQLNERPKAYLRKNELRIRFDSVPGHVQFTAHFEPPRIPTDGYNIHFTKLRLSEKPTLAASAERGWIPATVITGQEAQALAGHLLESLTPKSPGHGQYYQGLMADRLLYRDARGSVRSTSMELEPAGLAIDGHFSIQETLQMIARSLESDLLRSYPGQSVFLIAVPNSQRFPLPLLLDIANRRCIWLALAGPTDPERSLSLVTSPEGLKALLLEAHGLALLKNPVSSAARLVDLGIESLARLIRLPLPSGAPPPVKPSTGLDLVAWEKWLDQYTGTRLESGSLRLLIDGDQFFPRLRQAMVQATNYIHFESFIFDRDDVATEMADQLKQLSPRVNTEVLMDRMGSLAAALSPPATPLPENFVMPASISSYLRNGSAVRVRHFLNPWFSADHSKVYLVDGKRAWIGGMNIGREYRFEWHDMMVELEGPVVGSLSEAFERHWAHEGPLGDLGYLAALLRPRQADGQAGARAPAAIQVRRLPTRTFWKPFNVAVQTSLRKARNYIYLENPYLFDRRVIRGLVRARSRGVDVRVVLPRVNDFKAGARSNLVIANFLMTHGVRVFFYPGMTHVKALLVDDWACVGSGNLNHLSLRLSQEENIATSDHEFISRLKRDLFERDFARSYELTEPLTVNWLDFLADLAAENL